MSNVQPLQVTDIEDQYPLSDKDIQLHLQVLSPFESYNSHESVITTTIISQTILKELFTALFLLRRRVLPKVSIVIAFRALLPINIPIAALPSWNLTPLF